MNSLNTSNIFKTRRTLPGALIVTMAGTLAAGTLLSLFVGGCGGSGGGTAAASSTGFITSARSTGRAIVTVQWPVLSTAAATTTASRAAGTRLIPEAAGLILLNVYRMVNGVQTLVGSGQAVRTAGSPTSTIEVDNLPIDTLTAVATAYPGTDPANPGTAVATGSVPVMTQDGQVVGFTLTLASTIDHIDLAPVNPTLTPGTTLPLTATAYNGPDETTASVVMLSPDQLQWSSSDNSLATVDTNGIVKAVGGGHPMLFVKDAESGKTASTTLTIPLVVTVSPAAPVVSVTYSTTLTATVAGTSNQAVTWSVVEPNGGRISASGVYIAPAIPTPTKPTAQPYHITATSQADPTVSVTVPVTVQAGSATGTIQ